MVIKLNSRLKTVTSFRIYLRLSCKNQISPTVSCCLVTVTSNARYRYSFLKSNDSLQFKNVVMNVK